MRVIQIRNQESRQLAVIDEDRLRPLAAYPSLYDLAIDAERLGVPIDRLASEALVDTALDYDPIYRGESEWKVLPAFDHPTQPARCLVSGTGLTHTGSARSRNTMHKATATTHETDSMRMFRWGIEGGKPIDGGHGTAPEWFFKGTGHVLRASGSDLEIPGFAESGGEESEIAGLYIVGSDGQPRRVGYATGNEFSDHVLEKRNYLYLAHSKLRNCSLGPEAVIGENLPQRMTGHSTISRQGTVIWEEELESGEANMCHSIANIEHHHFKYSEHRRPGDAHVHFFGAAVLSFSAGIRLESGDLVTISWDGLGRPLRNTVVRVESSGASMVPLAPL